MLEWVISDQATTLVQRKISFKATASRNAENMCLSLVVPAAQAVSALKQMAPAVRPSTSSTSKIDEKEQVLPPGHTYLTK